LLRKRTGRAAVGKLFIKNRYIEVVSDYTMWRVELTFRVRCRIGLVILDQRSIGMGLDWRAFGKFTRENVYQWLWSHAGPDPGSYPVDFHAVWGDTDIPWATKEGFERYHQRNPR
jgi:hypothetical protein